MSPFHIARALLSRLGDEPINHIRAYPLHFSLVSTWTNPVGPVFSPIVKLSKTTEGILYSKIGSLLSGFALLAIFVYQMLLGYLLEHGGTYPSAGIVIVSLILLAFGTVLSFCGARMLHSHAGLVVPLATTITLLFFFIQWEWCLRYCVVP